MNDRVNHTCDKTCLHIYDHARVIWLRTHGTDHQLGELLRQRDDAVNNLHQRNNDLLIARLERDEVRDTLYNLRAELGKIADALGVAHGTPQVLEAIAKLTDAATRAQDAIHALLAVGAFDGSPGCPICGAERGHGSACIVGQALDMQTTIPKAPPSTDTGGIP